MSNPRKGTWTNFGWGDYKCSRCKRIIYLEKKTNFCPECGSDNRGKEMVG